MRKVFKRIQRIRGKNLSIRGEDSWPNCVKRRKMAPQIFFLPILDGFE
jgi:hypothetical protein